MHDRVAVLEPRGYAWVLSGLPYAAGLVRSVAAAHNPCEFDALRLWRWKTGWAEPFAAHGAWLVTPPAFVLCGRVLAGLLCLNKL